MVAAAAPDPAAAWMTAAALRPHPSHGMARDPARWREKNIGNSTAAIQLRGPPSRPGQTEPVPHQARRASPHLLARRDRRDI